MKMISAATEQEDTSKAISEVIEELKSKLQEDPMLIQVSYTVQHEAAIISEKMAEAFPGIEILGGSTHRGLFTEKGIFGFEAPALGALAICDDDAEIGVAVEGLPDGSRNIDPMAGGIKKSDIKLAVERALNKAQERADRVGELPDLIWTYITPGLEDDTVEAIVEIFGEGTRIVGMSVADNDLSGGWSMLSKDIVQHTGVGVACFYTTDAVTHYIQSGFMPQGPSGVVTESCGRVLASIDGKPSQEVFKEWNETNCIKETGELCQESLGLTSLAHRVGEKRTANGTIIEDFCLVSLYATYKDGFQMFTNPIEGERVYIMRGEKEGMENRLGKVSRQSVMRAQEIGPVAGGMVVMCAGYVWAMQNDTLKSVQALMDNFEGTPMLGAMGFGEQGTFLNGKCSHGNWMVSSTVFNS